MEYPKPTPIQVMFLFEKLSFYAVNLDLDFF